MAADLGALSTVQSGGGDESCSCYVLGGDECVWECVEEIPLCEAVSTVTIARTLAIEILG